METVRRIVITTLTLGAFGGVGGVLWLLVAPGEQRRLEMSKNYPEANPATLAEVRKRNELVLQVIKEAAETNENVSRKSPWK
ncbi:ubiquinol-cytochrome-c reductase complex assembly factor 3 [Pelobates cultripes]|uniref:Ubiquinol-cytochrome-c reductase complex assembly factor 3 n=1 Tax=Pelobates cultripes TaxID=61616 RepID=A0AAD1VPE2_PELCU|nr:ubiquinol-cytochrome-c reductase complex assembly factor 3 [Pelobates cultripes]